MTSLMDFHSGWRARANEASETTKLFTMLGAYIRKPTCSDHFSLPALQSSSRSTIVTRLPDGMSVVHWPDLKIAPCHD